MGSDNLVESRANAGMLVQSIGAIACQRGSVLLLGALLVTGCAGAHPSGGLLKGSPPASFPECTFYGYYPTCWVNWQPGWNCCPLPVTPPADDINFLETMPAPAGVPVGFMPPASFPPSLLSPPSEPMIQQVGFVSPLLNPPAQFPIGSHAVPMDAAQGAFDVTRLPSGE